MRNSTLQAAVNAVMQAATPAQYSIAVTFVSQSNASFSFSPLVTENLHIQQEFTQKYSDDIRIEFHISYADYANLYDQQQDLHAVLVLTYLTYDARVATSIAPVTRKYKATIVNPQDVRRTITDAQLRTTLETVICMRLIEDTVYTSRQVGIHGIYQSTTLSDVCRHIAQTFGFKQLYMVPLDNIHVYDHVLIPPLKDITNIYTWLHLKYGLYMTGINYYVTNNTLYIYPPYDTNPTFPSQTTVYQTEQGAYAGAPSFHKITGNSIEIVTNLRPKADDASQASSENVGTSHMFLRASALIDGVVTVDNTNGAQFDTSTALSVRLNTTNLANPSAQNSKYATATDNPFLLASNLSERQTTVLTFSWPHGLAFSLQPGGSVVYNSDENGTTVKRTGIIESATYMFGRADRVHQMVVYVCMATVKLRLQAQGTKA